MKRKYIHMSILIQGPKQPGNDLNLYLQLLKDELDTLWNTAGVNTWDATTGDYFPMSIDTGRASTDDSQQKKDRSPNQLKPVQEVILEVDPKSGLPKLPEEATRGYGNSVACILRDTVTINEQNIRQKLKKSITALMISKLHAQYQFSSPYNGQELTGNVVNTVALGKMSKALST
jgi:hypothetical protein